MTNNKVINYKKKFTSKTLEEHLLTGAQKFFTISIN